MQSLKPLCTFLKTHGGQSGMFFIWVIAISFKIAQLFVGQNFPDYM